MLHRTPPQLIDDSLYDVISKALKVDRIPSSSSSSFDKEKQKRDAMGHSIRRLKVQRMVMREMPGRVKDARDAPDAEHGAAPNGMQMSR